MHQALLPRRCGGMFRLMVRLTRRIHLLAAFALAGGDVSAQGPDPWRPQTVPLFGASYSPDIGLLVGAGISHTRYGFRALPPSTRLLAEAAYATSAGTYRIDVAGEFRRPLLPTILSIELRASGLELIRFYGVGNKTKGSEPRSEEHTSELQSRLHLVCRLLLEKKK